MNFDLMPWSVWITAWLLTLQRRLKLFSSDKAIENSCSIFFSSPSGRLLHVWLRKIFPSFSDDFTFFTKKEILKVKVRKILRVLMTHLKFKTLKWIKVKIIMEQNKHREVKSRLLADKAKIEKENSLVMYFQISMLFCDPIFGTPLRNILNGIIRYRFYTQLPWWFWQRQNDK